MFVALARPRPESCRNSFHFFSLPPIGPRVLKHLPASPAPRFLSTHQRFFSFDCSDFFSIVGPPSLRLFVVSSRCSLLAPFSSHFSARVGVFLFEGWTGLCRQDCEDRFFFFFFFPSAVVLFWTEPVVTQNSTPSLGVNHFGLFFRDGRHQPLPFFLFSPLPPVTVWDFVCPESCTQCTSPVDASLLPKPYIFLTHSPGDSARCFRSVIFWYSRRMIKFAWLVFLPLLFNFRRSWLVSD